MKKLLLKIGCLVGVVLVLFLGWQFYDNKCVKRDLGYMFYYNVIGGNGSIVPDYETYGELKSPIEVLGNGISFIAIPDEGCQVKNGRLSVRWWKSILLIRIKLWWKEIKKNKRNTTLPGI